MPPLRQIAASATCAWLLCSAAPASGAAARGHVVYATQEALYLDVGRADGLQRGDVLSLEVSGWHAAHCEVRAVSDHAARCSAAPGVQAASFALPRAAPTEPAAKPLPPPLSARTERRFASALQGSPPLEIRYKPRGTRRLGARSFGAWAALSHDGWMEFGGAHRNFQRERLDIGLIGAQLVEGSPWQASVRMTGMAWTAGNATSRYRPNAPAQLYVWQAQIDNRRRPDGLQVAAGRILPAYAPGMAVLDGAQVGYRLPERNIEVGGYTGLLPNLRTSAPSIERFTVGAYNNVFTKFGRSGFFQNNARLAFVALPQGNSRFELETLTDVRAGQVFHLGINPRFGLLTQTGRAALEAIRADASLDYKRVLHLYAGVRYATQDIDIVSGVSEYATALRTTTASQAALTVQPTRWLSASVLNAVASDQRSGFTHVLTGPELGLPRLFGNKGGISVAYLHETGSTTARSAFAQAQWTLRRTTSLWLRTSYFEDTFAMDARLREMSLYVGLRAPLTHWLTLDVSALGRHGFHNARLAADAPYSLRTSLRLTGRL